MQRAKCERSRWGIVRSRENEYLLINIRVPVEPLLSILRITVSVCHTFRFYTSDSSQTLRGVCSFRAKHIQTSNVNYIIIYKTTVLYHLQCHEKTRLVVDANNQSAAQSANPHSLISVFVIRFLDSIMTQLAIRKKSIFEVVFVVEQTGLSPRRYVFSRRVP